MSTRVRGGNGFFGRDRAGITGYPIDRIYEEVSFIAYYFHWPYEQILAMEHRERRRWCEEISRIHRNVNKETEKENVFDVFKKR